MARVDYLIRKISDGWFIKVNERDFGPYDSAKLAYSAAVDAAHASGRNGLSDARVVQLNEQGEQALEWVYGRDRYPIG